MAKALLDLRDREAFPNGTKSYRAKLSKEEEQLLRTYLEYRSITLNPNKLLDVQRAMFNLRHVLGKSLTSDFTLDDVKAFLRVLYSSTRSDETKKSTGEHLFAGTRSFMKWRFKDWSARFNNFLDEGGAKLVKWRVQPICNRLTENDLISEEELQKLGLACGKVMDKAIIALHGCTPARTKEIRELRWRDVLFSQNRIRVYDSKTTKSREMPVDSATMELLKRWHDQYEVPRPPKWSRINSRNPRPPPTWYVFPNYRTPERPITSGAVWRLYKRAATNARITKNIFGYLNRHSVISRYQKSGVDIRDVATVAGHSSISTTLRYTHLNQSHSISQVVKKVFEAEQPPEVKRPEPSTSEPPVQDQIARLLAQLVRILTATDDSGRSPG